MKIDIQPREDHQVILTVEVEPQMLEDAKARAARHISKHTKIPGFRPGKAPLAVVQRTVGAEAILEEAVELLINDVYPKALDESGIEPYGPGSLENVKSMTPPVFEFIVPLRAEVELGDYQSIRLPYELSDIRDEEVENVISGLLEQQAVVEPVERKAQEGDLIYLHLDAHRKQPKEGESQTIIDNRAIPVVVLKEDDDSSNDWPFPGFSRKLIDLSSGEEVSFEYDFPEDAANESLQGVKADFHVSVDAVNSRTLPELNDEFAQSVGDFPTLDSLRSQIRKNLEEQNLEMYHETYDEDLLEMAHSYDGEGFYVLPSGESEKQLLEFHEVQKMIRMIEDCKDRIDIAIIDAPPLMFSDALMIASEVDGVLAVIRSGKTTQAAAQRMIQRLKSAEANLLGIVLNFVSNRHLRTLDGYGYHSKYYYAGRRKGK